MNFFRLSTRLIQQGLPAGHRKKLVEESHQRGLRGVAKHTRSQSTKAGSSEKKTQQEPVIEVPSRGTSSLAIDPEHVHAGSEEDEDSEIPLLSRSGRTKGPAVILTKARPTEDTGR